MQYLFKQAVKITKRKEVPEKGLVNPKDQFEYDQIFHLGKREVPEAVESDPYFLQLVKCGLVLEVDTSKDVPQESPEERAKRLYDKLMAKKVEAPKPVEPEEVDEAKPKKKK